MQQKVQKQMATLGSDRRGGVDNNGARNCFHNIIEFWEEEFSLEDHLWRSWGRGRGVNENEFFGKRFVGGEQTLRREKDIDCSSSASMLTLI